MNNITHDFNKILEIVKSFDGKIYGDFVRDFYVITKLLTLDNSLTSNDYTTLNIIISNELTIKYLVRMLNLCFEIYKDVKPMSLDKDENTIHQQTHSFNMVYNIIQPINNQDKTEQIIELDTNEHIPLNFNSSQPLPPDEPRLNDNIDELPLPFYYTLPPDEPSLSIINNNYNTQTIIISSNIEQHLNQSLQKRILKINIFSDTMNLSAKDYLIHKTTNNIDCNMIATNVDSIFLVNNDLLKQHANILPQKNIINIDVILPRIMYKKFCFVKKIHKLEHHLDNINEAIRMIRNGWVMDDYCQGKNSCVLVKWANIKDNNYRLNYTVDEYQNIYEHTYCIICGSKFNEQDIVINTKCNHTFHYVCNSQTISSIDELGLRNWITNYNNNCPICRSSDFI
jgi:hypothetical protein